MVYNTDQPKAKSCDASGSRRVECSSPTGRPCKTLGHPIEETKYIMLSLSSKECPASFHESTSSSNAHILF